MTIILFCLLTVLTQVGGFVYLLSILTHKFTDKWTSSNFLKSTYRFTSFLGLYCLTTFLIAPVIAKPLGRVPLPITETSHLQPLNILTCFLNRNCVRSELKHTAFETIKIEDNLYEELKSLSLEKYPLHYYQCSNYDKIVSEYSIGSNVPYKRLKKSLKLLGIDNKGYNLYSFKHFSNIQRYNSGWKILEIMKANRHSSIAMTEKYLKHINRDTDISDRLVPKI